jgi:site-specific DNA-methyltransferase (adenine-specific)
MLAAKLHPACLLFPRLEGPELHALADDIRRNGLLNPIVTLGGKVLDGRNRLEACKLAGVKPRFVEWTGSGSPLAWVVSTNLIRRHLSASQRAVVAFDLLPMLEAEAKQRQRRSSGRGKKVANELATFSDNGKASHIAAQITNANSAYVEKVKAISRQAPELVSHLRSGKFNVIEATRLARLGLSQRQQVIAAAAKHPNEPTKRIMRRVIVESVREPVPNRNAKKAKVAIWCGDCIQVMRKKIADASISIVTTSPPYNRRTNYRTYKDDLSEPKYFEWLGEVFVEIERVLKPDGSFFLVVGHSPKKPWMAMQVSQLAGKFFALQNQIIWVKSINVGGRSRGHFSPIQGKRFVNRAWEFVFHFTKNGRVPLDRLALGVPYEAAVNSARTGLSRRCGGDVWFIPQPTVHGSEDRADHPATFPPELAERCIKLAGIQSNTAMLDPFCGVNGMIAAARLGIRGIGIDLDPAYCRAARHRVQLASEIPVA